MQKAPGFRGLLHVKDDCCAGGYYTGKTFSSVY